MKKLRLLELILAATLISQCSSCFTATRPKKNFTLETSDDLYHLYYFKKTNTLILIDRTISRWYYNKHPDWKNISFKQYTMGRIGFEIVEKNDSNSRDFYMADSVAREALE